MKDNNIKQALLFWVVLALFILVFWLHEKFGPDRSGVWPVKLSPRVDWLVGFAEEPGRGGGQAEFEIWPGTFFG